MPPEQLRSRIFSLRVLHTCPLVNYFVQGPLVMNNVLVSKVNICEVPGTLRRISIL